MDGGFRHAFSQSRRQCQKLRGEISTYSDETLDLYGRFIAQLGRNNQNLAEMIMRNTALLYGYESLEDLEAKL